jgi:WD40 repeat protein
MVCNYYTGPPFKHVLRTQEHKNYPNVIRFAPNGEVFASAGSDKRVVVYNAATGEKKSEFGSSSSSSSSSSSGEEKDGNGNGHSGSIFGMAWSPDSKQVVTASADKTVKLWDVESGNCVRTWHINSSASSASVDSVDDQQASVTWLPLSNTIVSVSQSGALNFIEQSGEASKDKQSQSFTWFGHANPILSAAVDRAHNTLYTSDSVSRLAVWDLKSMQATWFTANPKTGNNGHNNTPIAQLAVSCDGSTIYSSGYDNNLNISSTSGTVYGDKISVGFPVALTTGQVTSDLAATASDSDIKIIRNKQVVHSIAIKYKASKLYFSADDTVLACAGGDSRLVHLYSVNDGSAIKTLDGEHEKFCSTVVFNNSGKSGKSTFLASTQNNEVDIWDASGSSFDRKSFGWSYHTAKVDSARFNANGDKLVTAAGDKAIIIWKDFASFTARKNDLKGDAHQKGVIFADFVDDSDKSLVSVGADVTIKTWNLNL